MIRKSKVASPNAVGLKALEMSDSPPVPSEKPQRDLFNTSTKPSLSQTRASAMFGPSLPLKRVLETMPLIQKQMLSLISLA